VFQYFVYQTIRILLSGHKNCLSLYLIIRGVIKSIMLSGRNDSRRMIINKHLCGKKPCWEKYFQYLLSGQIKCTDATW
jgi:hypothetical protein